MRTLFSLFALCAVSCTQDPPVAGSSPGLLHSLTLPGPCEAVVHEARTGRIFALLPERSEVWVYSALRAKEQPERIATLGSAQLGAGTPTGLAASPGLVAVALARDKHEPGQLVFVDPATLKVLQSLPTGMGPDCVVLSDDGLLALSADEGRDSKSRDPLGSLTLFRRQAPGAPFVATRIGFEGLGLQGQPWVLSRGKDLAHSLEPESIALCPDGQRAFVSCQDNNAVLDVDLVGAKVRVIHSLGLRSFAAPRAKLDPSDADGGLQLGHWPVETLPMADGICSFALGGRLYFATANEGERLGRSRVRDLVLDPQHFPDPDRLQKKRRLGRLAVHAGLGDADGDGRHERLIGFGGRSFSIYSAAGELVWDSGDDLIRQGVAALPDRFDDDGSPLKGVEPEGIATGLVAGRRLLFVGLERLGAVAVYDASRPTSPSFLRMLSHPSFRRPEGLCFVPAAANALGQDLLLVAFEAGGIGIYTLAE